MVLEELSLRGAFTIAPKRFGDLRGFFSETFRASTLQEAGVTEAFVQDNHARSERCGTLRGLHFQHPPFAQGKLVRCVRGRILDVVVDLRRSSATFGKSAAVELSDENWMQIYVPVGFAHGYLTLTEGCEVIYKTTAYYKPESEGGVRWNDPALSIEWPLPLEEILLNSRDAALPGIADFESPF